MTPSTHKKEGFIERVDIVTLSRVRYPYEQRFLHRFAKRRLVRDMWHEGGNI